MKTLTKAIAIASVVSAGLMTSQVASAEVELSAQLDSMYLFRGQDQGVGGLISAAIDYSHESGLYVGTWIASAPEYDVYFGYGIEVSGLELDLGMTSYAYPNAGSGVDSATGLGEEVEVYVNAAYMGASFHYSHGLEALDKSSYMALGYSTDQVGVTYGLSDDGFGKEYSHIDVSYGLSEELTLTLSKAMDDSSAAAIANPDQGAAVEDLQVLVTYVLPLK